METGPKRTAPSGRAKAPSNRSKDAAAVRSVDRWARRIRATTDRPVGASRRPPASTKAQASSTSPSGVGTGGPG